MKETARIKAAYRTSKNIYDMALTRGTWWSRLYNTVFWDGVDDVALARRLLDRLPSDFDGRLLDVPVGTGVFTADKYAALPGADIVCLDYSVDMLRKAKARFAARDIAHVRCVRGDVGSMSFGDGSFDAVLSMNGFHAFPHKERAFRETCRVLKAGGVFFGCFYVKGQCVRSDLLVDTVLSRMGWFTPPFYSMGRLKKKLEQYYTQVELWNEGAIACFWCVK